MYIVRVNNCDSLLFPDCLRSLGVKQYAICRIKEQPQIWGRIEKLTAAGFSASSFFSWHIPVGHRPNLKCYLQIIFIVTVSRLLPSVLNTVDWVSGRASSLWLSDGVFVWLSVWSEVQIVCIWSSWCHFIPKPHHLLPHLTPDRFYLSGTALTRLSWQPKVSSIVIWKIHRKT